MFSVRVLNIMLVVIFTLQQDIECLDKKIIHHRKTIGHAGLTFGDVSLYYTTKQPSTIKHLEVDKFRTDEFYILYLTSTHLSLTDGTDEFLIAGHATKSGYNGGVGANSRFYFSSSFVQLNSTHTIISDSFNSCLRQVFRETDEVTDYAGKCQDSGYEDGALTSAQFYTPTTMIKGEGDSKHMIFIVDYVKRDYFIRSVNTKLGKVGTVVTSSSELDDLTGLVLHMESKNILLASANRYLKKVDITSNADQALPAVFLSPTSGADDGKFGNASFYSSQKLIALSGGVYMTSGIGISDRIRVIDMVDERVSSVCKAETYLFKPGSISECNLQEADSIFLSDQTVYIGGKGKIFILSMTIDKVQSPDVISNSEANKNTDVDEDQGQIKTAESTIEGEPANVTLLESPEGPPENIKSGASSNKICIKAFDGKFSLLTCQQTTVSVIAAGLLSVMILLGIASYQKHKRIKRAHQLRLAGIAGGQPIDSARSGPRKKGASRG